MGSAGLCQPASWLGRCEVFVFASAVCVCVYVHARVCVRTRALCMHPCQTRRTCTHVAGLVHDICPVLLSLASYRDVTCGGVQVHEAAEKAKAEAAANLAAHQAQMQAQLEAAEAAAKAAAERAAQAKAVRRWSLVGWMGCGLTVLGWARRTVAFACSFVRLFVWLVG